MTELTEEQKAVAQQCSSIPAGVKELKRFGMSEGRAIKLIATVNPGVYNTWRKAEVQSKARPLASSRFRFLGA
jgi:uncharacterized protein YoaH (UPF0181 family)